MVLGSRGGPCTGRWWRCLLVWVSGTIALGAIVLLARPAAARGWADRASLDVLPLDRTLADLAAVVLLGCAAWGWMALTITVGEVLLDGRPAGIRPGAVRRAARPWRLPEGLRRLVLAGCGVALATGLAQPALASPGGHHHSGRGLAALSGLPLPERAVAPGRHPASGHQLPARASGRPPGRIVVVRSGDCLWSIAARDLPADAAAGAVAAHWHAIYALNRAVIGPDPGLVEPGQHLVLPARPRRDPS